MAWRRAFAWIGLDEREKPKEHRAPAYRSDKVFRRFEQRLGYPLNLENPLTFNEKMHWRKLKGRDPRWPAMTDKIEAKRLVSDALGEEWITPTLWSGKELPPRSDRDWRKPYAIKANNGGGGKSMVFVREDDEIDWSEIERESAAWLRKNKAKNYQEWAYGEIEPQLLVEPFIGDAGQLPLDFKLHCFGGRVEIIHVDTDRETVHKRRLFDRSWNALPFSLGYPLEPRELSPPASLDRMIWAAERLAADFDYLRVDFYEDDGRPRFGEFTLYQGSGLSRFDPPEWDRKIGDLWVLSR